MGHPDFRVKKKIFATLGAPDAGWGMVKLTPEQQKQFVCAEPNAFVPVKGGWGLRRDQCLPVICHQQNASAGVDRGVEKCGPKAIG